MFMLTSGPLSIFMEIVNGNYSLKFFMLTFGPLSIFMEIVNANIYFPVN